MITLVEHVGETVVFLRRGLASLPDDQREDHATGLILAFVVEDLEGELARLRAGCSCSRRAW